MINSGAVPNPKPDVEFIRPVSPAEQENQREHEFVSQDTEREGHDKRRKKSSYGKTMDGTVFKIPETHNMISSLFDPRLPKSSLDLITLLTLTVQMIPLILFPRKKLKKIYLTWFLFWRLTYNVGLGWILKHQSENKFLIKVVKNLNLFDSRFNPRLSRWIEQQLKSKMSTHDLNYDLNQFPIEFNVWLLFRQLVDIILLNDFFAYFCLSYCSLKLPNQLQDQPSSSSGGGDHHQPNLSTFLIRWIVGVLLVGFNVWVKLDAHRIVHDFAWYWGDAFFLSLQELVFDGVFEMAPHPMYSIGYAGFYGASLITGSKSVFFVSLFAHLCQFGFLVYFENPHIQRTYGPQARPLTATSSRPRPRIRTRSLMTKKNLNLQNLSPITTTATDENSKDLTHEPIDRETDDHHHQDSRANHHGSSVPPTPQEHLKPPMVDPTEIREQLEHKLFSRKEMILIKNFDRFRSIDVATALAIGYSLLILFIDNGHHYDHDHEPAPRRMIFNSGLTISWLNALIWRIWFSFGLGLRLRHQSKHKLMVRHFLTKYYYPIRNFHHHHQVGHEIITPHDHHHQTDPTMDELKFEVIEECFHNWKAIYNLSLIMTYVSFAIMSIKFYRVETQSDLSPELVRVTFGLCLVGIHVWTALSTYEVLGKFGWFYGDFFVDDYPMELTYAGIYRYLNNPERSMGGAGFIGMALMSGNKFVFGMAIGSILCHWWFLSFVETPHMKKVYGDRIRKDAGLTKVLKQNAQKLASRTTRTLDLRIERESGGSLGGRSEEAKDVKGFEQRFKEVQGTFEFIYGETVQALDEFLEKSAPRLSGVVRDTKVLLQSSGERLILTRVANDLSSYDTTQYDLTIQESMYHPARDPKSNRLRFHMGEPIRVNWTSPWNHSRADWIGCYRRGSNKSGLVTQVTSSGRWCGLFEEEWQGDMHIGKRREDLDDSRVNLVPQQTRSKSSSTESSESETDKKPRQSGSVVFKAERLPWEEGVYEFRFHHDGKYNVMAITEPFEIYAEKIEQDVENMKEMEDKLRRLVGYGLGMDSRLIPKKLEKKLEEEEEEEGGVEGEGTQREGNQEEERACDRRAQTNGFEGVSDDGDGEEEEEDRFTVMSFEEAKRIQRLLAIGIGIELGIEIILEDCEISRLAKRIIFVKSLLQPTILK